MYNLLLQIFLLISFEMVSPDNNNWLDVINYHIQIRHIDFEQKQIQANTGIIFRHFSTSHSPVEFSLIGYTVDSCFLEGEKIIFDRKNDRLLIQLPENNAAKNWTLDVYYHGSPVQDQYWGGFFIEEEIAYNYGVGMAAEPPVFGRSWFPSHDVFTDRATFYFSLNVPTGFTGVANGKLISVTPKGDKICYKYHLKDSIPTYLASIAIGKFDVLKKELQSKNGNIPFEAFFPEGDYAQAQNTFALMQEGFSAYEHLFGAYIWDRVGYVATPFHGGAMEHATNIAYSRACHTHGCESTIYHELSHHWFGNLVTCADEKDMWLNEGWATYSEYLYFEQVYGKERAQQHLAKTAFTALKMAIVNDGGYIALDKPSHLQTYGTNIYKKGALMVHNLRTELGDSLFFSTVQSYLHDYAFKNISIIEFKEYFEQKTQHSLDDYFQNWISETGYANFILYNTQSKKEKTSYKIELNIAQQLLAREKYAQNQKISITALDEKFEEYSTTINAGGQITNAKISLPFEPVLIVADPYNSVCDAQFTIKKELNTGDYWQNDDMYLKIWANKLSTDSLPVFITYHFTAPVDKLNQANLYTEYWQVQIPKDMEQEITALFLMTPQFKYRKLYYRASPDEKWMKLVNECTTRDMDFKVSRLRSGDYVFADL